MASQAAPANNTRVRIGKMVSGAVPTSGSCELLLVSSFEANAPTERKPTDNISPTGKVTNNAAISRSGSGKVAFDMTTFGQRTLEEGVGGAYTAPVTKTAAGISADPSGNKLVLASGTWPVGLVAGSMVMVLGFADGAGKNGSKFLARVLTAPAGVNLPLDPAIKTLVTETASGSVTVYNDGYQRFDRQINDLYYAEWFNPVSGVGNLANNILFTSFNEDLSNSQYFKGSVDFVFGDRSNLSDPLTLTTATPTNLPGPEWSAGPNVGALDFPEWGLGLRYAGALMDDVGIEGVKLTLMNPAKGSRVWNRIEDASKFRDDKATASLEITVKRDGTANAETILEDARDVNTVVSLSFGYVDGAGTITYYEYPECQPSAETADAVAGSGEGTFKLTYLVREAPVIGYRQKSVFKAA